MYPHHLDTAYRVDDRDLSRAAAERHLMLQDFRLSRPSTARSQGLGRLVPARLRRRPPIEAAQPTAATS